MTEVTEPKNEALVDFPEIPTQRQRRGRTGRVLRVLRLHRVARVVGVLHVIYCQSMELARYRFCEIRLILPSSRREKNAKILPNFKANLRFSLAYSGKVSWMVIDV